MAFKKHIPNFITLLNLLSGLIAAMFAMTNQLEIAAYFVILGIFFDFFDGFVARLLKVEAELGKQLDSLADVVTSGVAPGIVMYQLLMQSLRNNWLEGLSCEIGNWMPFEDTAVTIFTGDKIHFIPFIGLLLTLAAAYRLAKFNIDTRQTSSFIGLPTPAMALFVVSLPLVLKYNISLNVNSYILNTYVLLVITFMGSYIMNANISMFSLKFKTYQFKDNKLKYIFLLLAVVALVLLQFLAIPLIIFGYIAVSIINKILN